MKFGNDQERYQRYLCSPEWGQRRRAVHLRCNGVCERCRHFPMSHVHHLTYIRKYNELIEDLQGLCISCHEFVHGKIGRDPILDVPFKLWGGVIKKVYLAGKITDNPWRKSLMVPVNRDLGHRGMTDRENWIARETIVIPGDPRRLDYVGPFWLDVEHGPNAGPHAYSEKIDRDYQHGQETRYVTDGRKVRDLCFRGIRQADLVFAWLDSEDAYGTMCEIAYARGIKRHDDNPGHLVKPVIVVATTSAIDERSHWFPLSISDSHIVSYDGSVYNAWFKMIMEGGISCIHPFGPEVEDFFQDEDEDDDPAMFGLEDDSED